VQVIYNPLQEKGFICNLANHWFTIRKIEEDWFNLDSLLLSPQYLSSLYLSEFLFAIKNRGYSIFVVRGSFPLTGYHDSNTDQASNWVWVDMRNRQDRMELHTGDVDPELEAAIAASLTESTTAIKDTSKSEPAESDHEDEELMQAILLSQQIPQQNETKIVLPEIEKEDPKNVTTLRVRLLDGQSVEQKFLKTCPIQLVYDVMQTRYGVDMSQNVLVQRPQIFLTDFNKTLEQLQLHPSSALVLQKKPD